MTAGDSTRRHAAFVTHRGGCHCGRVRFEVRAPAEVQATECNCSICNKTGFLHLIVDRADFRMLSGDDALTEYRFNTGTARHLFCRHCGVKSFYVPRSHPEGFSVNVRCVDEGSIESISVRLFDGRHWEDGVDALRASLASEDS